MPCWKVATAWLTVDLSHLLKYAGTCGIKFFPVSTPHLALCSSITFCAMCVCAGKAFSYFASQEAWIKEVLYHPVSDDSSVCLLKTKCTPSQRVSQVPHKLWVCLQKRTGAIERAYCTCMAGFVCTVTCSMTVL